MKIYITSDTHFNHTNICGPAISSWDGGYRHFSSLQEMNDTIIDNINAVVGKNDVLYHLGDFAFGNKKEIPTLRERINCGTIHLLYGNHDEAIEHKFPEYQKLFASTGHYVEKRVNKKKVCMFHYPIAAWNENGRGSINLHGHSHGNFKAVGRQLDVGVDCHDFKPLLLEDVVAQVRELDVITVDHHTRETNYG